MKRFGAVLALALSACAATPATTTSLTDTGVTDDVIAADQQLPLASSTTAAVPVAGAGGIGDSLYPALGNGGYDVEHYELDLEFDGLRLSGTATLTLLATTALESFYLDLTGLDVSRVQIDGQTAGFEVVDELLVRPNQPLVEGQTSLVAVEYGGIPSSIANGAGQFRVGWHESTDGWFTLSEPAGADTWFPSNNHPLDKATFSLQITVPEGLVAVSSGVLTRVSNDGSTYLWESLSPTAPYLIALAIADFDRRTEVSAGGVAIVNYFDSDLSESDVMLFDRQGEMIDFFVGIFGPYPFAEYGALVLETSQTPAALETQTRPTFGTQILVLGEPVVAHELAHQWFGDSVSVADWSDTWLNEGFATYGQWLWGEHAGGPAALESEIVAAYRTLSGASLAEAVTDPKAAYEQASALYPPPGSPAIDDLFGTSVYVRGGLTLHSLRLELGDEDFFRLLERWATDNRYGNVSTDDFIALVDEFGGQNAVDMVEDWLFSPDLPSIASMGLRPPS